MSEKEITFRNGKAYLESSERVEALYVHDVTAHIPLHENEDYDKKELKELLARLAKEKDCEDSPKWIHRLLIHALREYREDGNLKDFLEDCIGYKRVEESEELDSLTCVMNTPIKLEKGTLFRHIWNYIKKDYEIFNVLFTDSLGGFDLKNWIDYAEIPHEKDEWERECEVGNYGMKKLQCYWNYTVHQGEYSLFKGEFGGWGTHKMPQWDGEKRIEDKIEEQAYGVSFTPINAMMDYPFELVEEIKIKIIEIWNGKKLSWSKLEPEINTKKQWTPYTMIEAILWEISFMGTPYQQDEKHDEINETIEGIKSGEIKTRPFEELRYLFIDEDEDEDEDEGTENK